MRNVTAHEEAICNLGIAVGVPIGASTYLWFGGWWGILATSLFVSLFAIGRYLKSDQSKLDDPLDLLAELVDPDPCWFDHHGYCQAHNLHEKPCPHERAKELLNATRQTTQQED